MPGNAAPGNAAPGNAVPRNANLPAGPSGNANLPVGSSGNADVPVGSAWSSDDKKKKKLRTVTYTYYEQLNGYKYLKELDLLRNASLTTESCRQKSARNYRGRRNP